MKLSTKTLLITAGLALVLAACEGGRGERGRTYTNVPSPSPDHSSPQEMLAYGRQGPIAPPSREAYQKLADNPVKRAAEHPVSTFSVDVDTGSYANARRFLNDGYLPPEDAVRVEEMINYFGYDYPAPESPDRPFLVTTEVAPTPWNPNTYLLNIGIKGYEEPRSERPPANLVFLVDVSGSMSSPDKLPLLVKSLKMLAGELERRDRISIVVYAGSSGVVLEPVPGNRTREIRSALGRLRAGGSTAGESGIRLAYDLAEEAWIEGGINRVILATDGDFNVGVTDVEALKSLIERKRDRGITLTTLGFGTGNYNEHLMEQIADVGNGNYAYIDRLSEARKVLVDEMNATLHTIAKDVKVQIEFNPAVVAEYRLVGYENRVLAREDFKNDKVDAGDIGAGHTVTALYEIALVGGAGQSVDPLRYGGDPAPEAAGPAGEFAFVKLRYKEPEGGPSKQLAFPMASALLLEPPARTTETFRFSAAVAAFGQLLRGGRYVEEFGYGDVLTLARGARGEDEFGYRSEFLSLVQTAETLDGQ